MCNSNDKKYVCRLCGNTFPEKEMSDEHYPAKSVGNDDIVALDFVAFVDALQEKNEIIRKAKSREEAERILSEKFDKEISKPLYPNGRTIKTLCRNCNTFLGKYDEAYLKFFNNDGNPKVIKGFQRRTKVNIIKAILGKFLSIPETQNIAFDFIDYLKDASMEQYNGKWNLYFIKRDYSTDLLGLSNIETGEIEFEEGMVYELSDEKFIFNMMDFPIHPGYKMTNMFDILNDNYELITGVNEIGGYHGQIMLSKVLSDIADEQRKKKLL